MLYGAFVCFYVSEAKPLCFSLQCLMVLNDAECTSFKMFVTQMSNYLSVISFQSMFYNTLHCSLEQMACLLSWMSGKETSAQKIYFHKEIDGE